MTVTPHAQQRRASRERVNEGMSMLRRRSTDHSSTFPIECRLNRRSAQSRLLARRGPIMIMKTRLLCLGRPLGPIARERRRGALVPATTLAQLSSALANGRPTTANSMMSPGRLALITHRHQRSVATSITCQPAPSILSSCLPCRAWPTEVVGNCANVRRIEVE